MINRIARPTLLFSCSLLAGFLFACSDSPTEPGTSVLAGLSQRDGRDSVGNPLPPPPTNPTPGIFHGTVLGPSVAGSADTLATAPRVAAVVVKAYPITGGTQANPELGPVEQTVTTGTDGKFSLSLSGGLYAVTFTPPASSMYSGVWVTGSTSVNSGDWPWWVILPRK
jgi:hypothetical protein